MIRMWLTAGVAALATTASIQAQEDRWVEEIMQADRDFAAMAAQGSIPDAFAHFMDADEGRLVRGTAQPLIGEAQIRGNFDGLPETTLLHWEPLEGFASAAGDMGTTWGVWSLHVDGDRNSAPAARGTYVTLWHRNAEGEWRGLLDMGTNDPSYRPPQPEADSQSAPEND
jgi:ketosteroid isomerase-like protein